MKTIGKTSILLSFQAFSHQTFDLILKISKIFLNLVEGFLKYIQVQRREKYLKLNLLLSKTFSEDTAFIKKNLYFSKTFGNNSYRATLFY